MQGKIASTKPHKDGGKPLWVPSQRLIDNSNLSRFITFVNNRFNLSITNYAGLYNWSVTEIEDFWKAVWDFAGIICSRQYDTILTNPVMPGAKWFEGARLNFAENLLRFRDKSTAIISRDETGITHRITYDELYRKVSVCAAGLRELGVAKGDRVAGFITNSPEAVIAMLAVSSIGAVWSSCSPDFGIQGVLDRFSQIKPKVLIAVAQYRYNGKRYDCSDKIAKIVSGLEELQNDGESQLIDLLEARIENAEGTMMNNLSADLYSDGTASGGKQIGGLQLLVADTGLSTAGGINSATWSFWQNKIYDFSTESATASATTIQAAMNTLWLRTKRNNDTVSLIAAVLPFAAVRRMRRR
ncbi:phage major capsid protein [candidate division KSB1 bacterium]|nr:phage major capsid protein [candidate division KSB1 bacterium]